MTHGRWRFSALAALSVVAGLAGSPGVVLAQGAGSSSTPTVGAPRLPSEVFAADPVTPDQLRLIEAYAELWVPQLLGDGTNQGGESQVVSARNELIQPLSFPGVSADFRTQYSRIISRRLSGAVAPDRPLIHRLNTLIVAARLQLDANVFALLLQALEDPSPAVRYWAVKALGGRPAGGLTAQQINDVIAPLEQMLGTEETLHVLQQVYQVLVDLPGTRGLDLVVGALNDRVGAHHGQPLLPYDAEHAGMRGAFQKILSLQPAGVNVDEPMRQLARAAAQYLALMGQQGQPVSDQLRGPLRDSYLRMAELSLQVLSQAKQHFAVGGAPLPAIGNQLNWTQINAAAAAARNMLTNPPFSFNANDLTPTP